MYRYYFLVILCCSSVISEDCVTVDFENGFENDFINNSGVCFGLAAWNAKQYSSVNMESPHPKSTRFIAPQTGISCVSSFKFTMTREGILEVNVYMIPAAPFDQLTVRVFQSVVGGDDVLVGTAVHISDSVSVWKTINMTIDRLGSFEGYVTLQSLTLSTNTIIWIDSFRYIGPASDKNSCVLYEKDQITTVIPTTSITEAPITTEVPNSDCVTANFESNFENDFTNDYGICVGLSAWNVKQYSSVDVESPHPKSTSFVTPQTGTSCVSSFKFTMTAGGTLEVNLYTMQLSPFDQLTVRVFQSVIGGDDILINTAFHISNSIPEWETLNMTINGHGSFVGYITFQSWTVTSNPIIKIDSFRYIGPSFEKDLCDIYKKEEITTVKPTTTTEVPNEDCVTANFEYNFEEDFTDYGICTGLLTWNVKQYSSMNVDSPYPRSTSFITPQTGISCVSSFKFKMTEGGTLEVNLYTMPVSQFDQLTVRVFQSVAGGDDILISTVFHNSNSIPDWETLNMTINGHGSFVGYVTFQAWTVSSNPIIKIDSFRYIGPSFDKDLCEIYKEQEITTVKPTTTTEAPYQECVTVNFEYNFEEDFINDYGVCIGLSAWNLMQYSTVSVDGPHPNSTSFITPQTGISCVSSFKFKMTAGGTLEVNVYTMPVSPSDLLTVNVFQSVDGEDDMLINRFFHIPNSVSNWETISLIINGYGTFEGYVTFQAWTGSTNPIIWIDSFRYVGLFFDKDFCEIYKEQELTTVKPTTTTEAPHEECVIANFEYNFEEDFIGDDGVCIGRNPWVLLQYSSINFDSPHPHSTSFITPPIGNTCISSFKFTMTAGGTLEVNVFMILVSQWDLLTVTVYRSVDGEDEIINNAVYDITNFVPNWETISMTINGYGTFEGYVTFEAWMAAILPILWIDSFRYVPPSFDKDSCVIYEDGQSTSVKPTTTTTKIPITSTTQAPTSTSTQASQTTTTEAPNENCVTVDFESNFEDDFNNKGVCDGLSAWNQNKYSSVDIDSPHPGSASFIAPGLGISCVSSFNFTMTTGGLLEVNVYMMPTSVVDQLTVTVFQSVNGGDDISAGRAFRNNMSSEFVPGWQTLNITVGEPGRFEGYVTFHTITISPDPIMWIDSFRYVAPSFDKDSCVIYKEDQIATTKPATTTEVIPSDDCVTVGFESNFEEDFNNYYGDCTGLPTWVVRQYSSVDINSPHLGSTRFIEAQFGFSCISSFKFSMTTGGMLEVNVYMIAISVFDQLTVTVSQSVVGADDVIIGRIIRNNWSSEYVSGWQTLNMTIDGPGRFDGYVTFHAMTLPPSAIIWIDSFRYIGPSSDKDSCVIYEEATTLLRDV